MVYNEHISLYNVMHLFFSLVIGATASSTDIPSQPQSLVRLSRNPQRRLHLAQDLHFTEEPPRQLQFTNTSGAVVNCVAKGVPDPTIAWTFADGRPLSQASP